MQLPFWADLLFGIIGLVAFLMTIFEIFGKPKIRIYFVHPMGYLLTCVVWNKPVGRVLSFFNVQRTQIKVSTTITIIDFEGFDRVFRA